MIFPQNWKWFLTTLALASCFSFPSSSTAEESSKTNFEDAYFNSSLLGEADGMVRREGKFNRNNVLGSDTITTFRPSLVLDIGIVGVTGRFKGETELSSEGDASFNLDILQLHRTFNLLNSTQINIGKVPIDWEVSFAASPVSFFSTNDRREDIEDRHLKTEGFPLVSLNQRFTNFDMELIYSDDFQRSIDGFGKGRRQWAARLHTQRSASDISLISQQYESLYPGVGGTITHVVGDALELHASIFSRKGTERPIHRSVAGEPFQFFQTGTTPLVRLREDDRDWYHQVVLGGQYTTSGFVNYTVEYVHDGRGLSSSEWERLLNLTDFHANGSLLGLPFSAVQGNLLFDAESLARQGSLRDYLFVRAAWSWRYFSPEASAFIGLLDGSVSLFSRLIYKGASDWDAGVDFNLNLGERGSEFGEVPEKMRLLFTLRAFY